MSQNNRIKYFSKDEFDNEIYQTKVTDLDEGWCFRDPEGDWIGPYATEVEAIAAYERMCDDMAADCSE